MHQHFRWLAAAAALLVLAACSKDKDIDKPTPLATFNATLRVQRVWTDKVADKGAKPLRLGLGLAVDDDRVYAAGHKGEIAAFDLKTGRPVWRVRTKLALSGGPGVGAGLVVAGSTFGDIIALNAADGALRWKVRVNGEVLSAPAVSERMVALRTVDGRLRALAAKDGRELWSQEQQVPRLSLRGTSYPVLSGDLVLCGFDNGKVAAVNVNDGSIQWETTIAPPHGKTELERLDDVDAGVRVAGSDVYAIGFQGRIAMLALDTGQIWWSHEASSYRTIGLDDEALYLATAEGDVVALRRRTGTEIWRQKALAHRRLSAAVESDNAIVTADYQGYVHWLDKATGAIVARSSSGKVRVSNPPVVAGNMVLVANDAGGISAFKATPIPGAHPAPAASAPPGTSGSATPATPATPATAAPPAAASEAGSASESTTPPAPIENALPSGPSPAAQPDSPPPLANPPAAPASPEQPPLQAPVTPQTQPLPPGTRPPPLPPQQTPDPVPPEPQTQPQPPPS
ncbi:MAG: outer membrane protein assembly factor BamB [Sinobacteraceae bacterium]|nr:outer membrane protein assembly factor BamB [Nevskiaceae bacterium]